MTRAELLVHASWSTWQRAPIIDEAIEGPLHRAIGAKCAELGCRVVAIGGTSDHVHLLARLHATVAIAKLVGAAKGYSSFVVTHGLGRSFRWQDGYWATSVSVDELRTLTAYVRNQRLHHRSGNIVDDFEP
jgi:putative transposase